MENGNEEAWGIRNVTGEEGQGDTLRHQMTKIPLR